MAKVSSKIKARISRILNLILKELEALFRDKQALIVIFLLPILVMIAIGSTGGALGAKSTVIIGVIDLDTSGGYPTDDLSEGLTEFLRNITDDTGKRYVVLIEYTGTQYNASEPLNALKTGSIDAYVVIPQGFETAITSISVAFVGATISSLRY